MAPKKIARSIVGIAIIAALAGCEGQNKGYIAVGAIEDPILLITSEYDEYVAGDQSLSDADRITKTRTSDLLRKTVTTAQE